MIKSKGYILKDLHWDTQFFGVKCLRVYIKEQLVEEQFESLKKEIESYSFITIDNENGSYQNNHLLCGLNNCYLVDVPVTFRFPIDSKTENVTGVSIKENFDSNSKILSIGKDAFKLGRFYKDENIPEGKASQLYINWLKSASNRNDKRFVIEENYNGFILFSETDDKKGLEIELIATDKDIRAKGYAKRMITALKSYAASRGYKYINVVTQADNIAAVNLYSRQGFKLISCMYTFHCWKRNQ
ncbi:MAG: GNAT family N-acetyltransferase [Clostridiaceae bacterium]|nr:GNAT family N-acetyltransferase [Clostridiaceae bacterium]